MDKDDFNKDLTDYIRNKKRKARGRLFNFFKNKDRGVKKMTVEEEKKEIEDMAELEREAEELEEEEEAIERQKEGLFRRLINKFKIANEAEEAKIIEEEELDHELDEDTKKVLKMSYEWLKYMPETKLKEFKESDDFKIYKSVLTKYGLAKEKKED
ncbi:MAG: hypothetical protein QXG00_01495 [Candidatus Woesearchaeota archaeon]